MNEMTAQDIASTKEYAMSIVGGELRKAVEELPPQIANMSVGELEEARMPTEVDYLLRENLWKQVEIAQKAGETHIKTRAVFAGVCSEQHFFFNIVKSPMRVAWLFTHPQDDIKKMRYGLSIGMKNLIKFISKEPNEKTAGAFLKAVEMLMNRVHGPIIQKVEAKHAHLNMNKPIENSMDSPADIIARLDELKSKLLIPRDVTQTNDNDPS